MLNRIPLPSLVSVLLLCSLLFSASSRAQESAAAENAEEVAAIRSALEATQPDMQIRSIELSPVPGLYEVRTASLQSIYASADARFFIPGDLYEAHPLGLMNHTESKRNSDRAALIAEVPESEMISFVPEGETVATLHVFTDVDCPYCRQLHGDIETLNDNGVRVNYLAFPRRGMAHETADKMIAAWCSDNPAIMLTTAKRGADIPDKTCANPVARHYELGRQVGVQGTPALVLEDGAMINGYLPVEDLLAYLLSDAP